MSDAGLFAIGGSTTSVADPRSLVLRLEVARLQSELERLEARLGELRPLSAAGSAPSADRTDRAGGPADELVDRMVATLLDSGRAEIVDAAARRQADAEAELEVARLRAGAIVDAARAELEESLAERGEAVRAAWARGFDEVDLVEPEHPAVVAAATVWEPAAAQPDASDPVGSETFASEPLASETFAGEPALPRAAEVEEARTDAAFDAWMAVGPTAMSVPEDVAEAPGPMPGPEGDAGPEPDPSTARVRSRWLLPLEVAAALLVAALLVVLGLVLVG